MKYASGEEVRLWDRIEVSGDADGIVVCSIDTDEYSPDFPRETWSRLGGGIMIATGDMGLVHLEPTFVCMRLVRRGGPPDEVEWMPFKRAIDGMGGGPSVH